MKYLIYTIETGRPEYIQSAVSVLDLNYDTGTQAAIELSVQDPFGSYVDGGILVSIPAAPSSRHVWDWTTKTWGLPSTIRADMKALVTAEASRRNAYPFNYSSHYYRCDAQGQAAILGAAAVHPTTVPSGWTWPDINGVPVAMNSTEWSLFWSAVADRPLGIQVVVEFLHSFIDDPSHSDAYVAAIEPSTDTYWPDTARP